MKKQKRSRRSRPAEENNLEEGKGREEEAEPNLHLPPLLPFPSFAKMAKIKERGKSGGKSKFPAFYSFQGQAGSEGELGKDRMGAASPRILQSLAGAVS